jgi:signal transduction histidine kinase
MGVSVFAHGMKNQVLSAQVLHKRMKKELAKESPDLMLIRQYESELSDLNSSMKTRLEEFYSTVRNNALTLVPVPVRDVVELSAKRFREKYPEGKLEIELLTDRKVLVDVSAISEAVYNLLINGYEAALAAGRADPKVQLSVRAERIWTVFAVTDHGKGISKEQRLRIFEPFYTSKSKNTNWGMGLFYVRRIVRKHFGHLKLESIEGRGSTFLLMLPRYGD